MKLMPKELKNKFILSIKISMKNIISYFFMIIILIFGYKSYAQNILVPHPTVDLAEYLIKCKSDGYICTHDYFKKTIIETESEPFNQFMESIDLQNEDYRKSLFLKIKNLLARENLNLDQIQLIVKIINRSDTIQSQNNLIPIKNELIELSNDLSRIFEERSDSEFYILHKVILTRKQYSLLKYKIKYSRVLKVNAYTEPTNSYDSAKSLISGECENARFSNLLTKNNEIKYIPLFSESCTNTDALTTSKSNFNLVNYKKPIIYTAVGLLLVGFFNQYKVDVKF